MNLSYQCEEQKNHLDARKALNNVKKKKIHSAGDDGQYHYNETNRLTTRILPTTRYLGYVINSYCRISNQLLDLLERRLCNQLLFRVKQRQIRKCRFHFCHSNIILKFGNIFLAE